MIESLLLHSRKYVAPTIMDFDTEAGVVVDIVAINTGTVNFTIKWGDDSSDVYTTSGTKSHTYISSGVYTIEITGSCHIELGASVNGVLTEFKQFGLTKWQSCKSMFELCGTAIFSNTDVPYLAECTDLSFMFKRAFLFNQDIYSWDVSTIITTRSMFAFISVFNQNISIWDVSNVINFGYMFRDNDSFNQNISSWDTSSGEDMSYMFYNSGAFNQDLTGWDVGLVTTYVGFNGGTSVLLDINKPNFI